MRLFLLIRKYDKSMTVDDSRLQAKAYLVFSLSYQRCLDVQLFLIAFNQKTNCFPNILKLVPASDFLR